MSGPAPALTGMAHSDLRAEHGQHPRSAALIDNPIAWAGGMSDAELAVLCPSAASQWPANARICRIADVYLKWRYAALLRRVNKIRCRCGHLIGAVFVTDSYLSRLERCDINDRHVKGAWRVDIVKRQRQRSSRECKRHLISSAIDSHRYRTCLDLVADHLARRSVYVPVAIIAICR
jgi:hypothetical protein